MRYLCDSMELIQNFDTLLPMECKNLQTALNQPEVVSQLVSTEVEKGFLLGPFSTPPFKNFRISPIEIAEGKYSGKKRLIVDSSAPQENEQHPSLNEHIDKEECSLTYVHLDDAISLIRKC